MDIILYFYIEKQTDRHTDRERFINNNLPIMREHTTIAHPITDYYPNVARYTVL